MNEIVISIYYLIKDFVIFCWEKVTALDTEEIALISIIVSFVIYILSKRAEIKLNKYEVKKEKYVVFLDFLSDFFVQSKYIKNNDFKGKKFIDFEAKFTDAGANLSVFGSRKLYKEFHFFRRLSVDDGIKKLKYFDEKLLLYSCAKMIKIMRKEAGLNNDTMSEPLLLSFFINDITKSEMMKEYYKSIYNRKMIKFMIIVSNITDGNIIYLIWFAKIKPVFSMIFNLLSVILLNLIIKLPKKLITLICGKSKGSNV